MNPIDINSDVGEGIGNETQLLPLLTSCNIACGGHAGDTQTMEEVTALALQYELKIGAHPGYEDKTNFGRVPITLSRKELRQSITRQIRELKTIVEDKGGRLHHVKPHGALYNQASVDREIASIIIDTIAAIDDELILYAPFNSVIAEMAKGILPIKIEGFADRNYNSDYTLVSRSQPNALITEPKSVMEHISHMVAKQQLHTITGEICPMHIETLCVHGDTPKALEILQYIRKEASHHNIKFE